MRCAEFNNPKYVTNRLFLKHRQNPIEIHADITAEILKNMELLGFRKIGDITISNLLRAEGFTELHDESDSPINQVREGHFSDLSPIVSTG